MDRADVIMVTHDYETMRAYCDAGAVLDDGRITLFDDLEEAIEQHAHHHAATTTLAHGDSMSTSIVASGQAAGSGYRLDADSDTRPAMAPLRQAEIHPSQTRPTQGHAGPGHTVRSASATAGGAGGWRRCCWPSRCRPPWSVATCMATRRIST